MSTRRTLLYTLLLLLGAAAWQLRPRPLVPPPEVGQWEAQLQETRPEVLLLGANLPDSQLRRMGRLLSDGRPLRVANLDVAAHAAFWYTALTNHVFAKGFRPELVVVVGSPGTILAGQPRSPGERLRLRALLNEQEPVLGPKLFGHEDLNTLEERFKQSWERQFPGTEGELPVPENAAENLMSDLGARVAEQESHLVVVRTGPQRFLEEQEQQLRTQLLSIGADYLDLHSATPETLVESLVDGLLRLGVTGMVRRYGPSRVTRVGEIPVLHTGTISRLPETVCEFGLPVGGVGMISDAATTKAGLGAASPLRLFQDGQPLRANQSRAALSLGCVGAFLHGTNGLRLAPSGTPEDSHQWEVRLDPSVPTTLADGSDVWWVYPGTRLSWRFDEPWEGPLNVRVEVLLLPPDAIEHGPELSVGDQIMPLLPDGPGGLWSAKVSLPRPPEEPWDIQVLADANGPWMAVTRLQIGEGDQQVRLIGQPPASLRLLEGRLRWETEPEAVEAEWVAEGTGGVFRVPAPLNGLADTVWEGRVNKGRCSPLRVAEDDKNLRFYHRKLEELRSTPDAVSHDATGVHFAPREGSTEGHTFRLLLAADRRCQSYRWLYPGDRLSIVAQPAQLSSLTRGAERLLLSALLPPGPVPPGFLHLEVFDGERSLLKKEIPYSFLDGTVREWMLPERVLSHTRLRVLLSSDHTAPYILLTSAQVAEASL